jgi:hypothetical protein
MERVLVNTRLKMEDEAGLQIRALWSGPVLNEPAA